MYVQATSMAHATRCTPNEGHRCTRPIFCVIVPRQTEMFWAERRDLPGNTSLTAAESSEEGELRYILIDKVTAIEPNQRIVGIKNVTLSEQMLHDHFPDFPVFPGALIVEAAAQLAGFLLELSFDEGGEASPLRALLVQIDKAKFHGLSGPGDQLVIEVEMLSSLAAAARVKAVVSVADKTLVKVTLTFAMKTIDVPAIHEQRRRLYDIWTRDLKLPFRVR